MSHLQPFKTDVSGISLPRRFTFPFYYEPHPLAEIAAAELQEYLETQTDFRHNFGLGRVKKGWPLGKMFGVLVVQNQKGGLGYLAAVSGNFQDKKMPEKLVPPIFNMRTQGSFYLEGEKELNEINRQVDELKQAPRLAELRETVENKTRQMAEALKAGKARLRANKADRKRQREEARKSMSEQAYEAFNQTLIKESNRDQWLYKELVRKEQESLGKFEAELEAFTSKIASLKIERKRKSAALQERIFEQYQFLNKDEERKNLRQIFTEIGVARPPSGAGDCAAPRLLQYAFAHSLKPIAMAEFWWGVSPPKEVRKHRYYYPACNGRCKPILGHMLQGIEMDEDPMVLGPSMDTRIEIVFEDDSLAIINKPHEFLSVPGKQVSESVYTRMRDRYPDATGPLIVHRLDMSTSGMMVIAKTEEAYKKLQKQFIDRTVKKRYTALLDGIIEQSEGEIDLPLRVDLDDRPRQLVCYEHGKKAVTRWKAVESVDGKTRVHFYPITGRTHQLRVHASHPQGLNTPIVGDDLYGRKADRLHLHAEWIEFDHPQSGERLGFEVQAEF